MNGTGLSTGSRLALTGLLLCLFAWLVFVLVGLQPEHPGVAGLVTENMRLSGVGNPVTAVLINFRGYDTLLETGVLLLAMLGVWSLGTMTRVEVAAPSQILSHLTHALVPLLILVAGYLLWNGAHSPGGAFQAGSVLGAGGVVMLLAGWRLEPLFAGLVFRLIACLGLGLFIATGGLLLLTSGELLWYPPAMAGPLILLIEAGATLSIAAILVCLFVGGKPELPEA